MSKPKPVAAAPQQFQEPGIGRSASTTPNVRRSIGHHQQGDLRAGFIGKDDPMGPQRLGAAADSHGSGDVDADIVLLGDLPLAALDVFFQQGIDPFQDRRFVPVGVFLQIGKTRKRNGCMRSAACPAGETVQQAAGRDTVPPRPRAKAASLDAATLTTKHGHVSA